MASRAWLPWATRPSSQRTVAVSPSTSMPTARAPLNRRTPRRMKSSSSAAATSGSFCGRTCCRLTMRVTWHPNAENMCTNSTPVTPEPTTTRCSGSSGGGYASRVVSTRSPSSGAQSGTRGRLPVLSSTTSASSSSRPSAVSTTISFGPFSRPVPLTIRTPWLSSRPLTEVRSLSSMARIRRRSESKSRLADTSVMPMPWAALICERAPPVAIIALDGMQSHRWAAPPTMSRSTSVTSAPSRAAWVAAWLPAGPPPMITKRLAMARGYRPTRSVAVCSGPWRR